MILLWTVGIVLLIFATIAIRRRLARSTKLRVAFLHPFCDDCAGGQKVLWFLIKALVDTYKDIEVAVYSVQPDKHKILDKAKKRFGIDLENSVKHGVLSDTAIQIVYVPGKFLLRPWPFMTLLFQMVLPMVYTVICLIKFPPDIFYDTTGYAFSFLSVRLFSPGTKCYAYVHYPFICNEMIDNVKGHRAGFHNSEIIAKSSFLTKAKIVYHRIVMKLYGYLKYVVDFAHTNSSWTQAHMQALWGDKMQDNLLKLYPPCSVTPLLNIPKDAKARIVIMSFAQFRPEKNQIMQISIFNEVCKNMAQHGIKERPHFSMVGSVRGPDDQRLLDEVKAAVQKFNLTDNVTFHVNQPFDYILKVFGEATHGLHTMEAEHFGISCVEMMAAGVILVAHNSAGPKADIIKHASSEQDRCGYLADNYEDYVSMLTEAILSKNQQKIRKNARRRAQQFSNEKFMENFRRDFEQSKKFK